MDSLFRREVISKRKFNSLGAVLEVNCFRRSTVIGATTLILILILLFLSFTTYTKRNTVSGEIISTVRPINISSQYQGYISEVYVTDGESVSEGQKLYKISTGKNTLSGDVGERNKEAISNQMQKTKEIIAGIKSNELKTIKNLEEQRRRYAELNESSDSLLKKTASGLKSYESTLNDYKSYQGKGFITKDQYVYQLNNYFQQQGLLNSINHQYVQEKMQIINTESDIATRKIEFQNQILEYELKLQDLEREMSAAEAETDVYVVAPESGKLETLNTSVGQYVTFNDNLAQMLPSSHGAYRLTLWVPDRNIPYLKREAPISIRYDAFAWQKFGQFSGHIGDISTVPASLQEMSTYRSAPREELVKSGGNYYKVICSLNEDGIVFDGQHIPLSNGLTANVTLYLETRPLWQWILSPLYEVRESVSGPV